MAISLYATKQTVYTSLCLLTGFMTCSIPLTPPAMAQIVPDNTLGSENSVVTPNVDIRGINSDRIDGGAVRGGNLFHSFQEFNVDVGRGVYFSNPDSIVNILTRVTGGNVSEILGTLGVIAPNGSDLGNANLFLINPNGIVFGPNARLDVGGSFFASTADGILFENGVEFAASNPEAPPLLTINIPLGLNIRENPGTIVNQTLPQFVEINGNIPPATPSGLYVPPEETIAFIGGEVRFESGVVASPGSRIELGGLSEPGIVELNSDGSLSFPANRQRADVLLTNDAVANVAGNPGGNIAINARNIEISGGSQVTNGVAEVSSLLNAENREILDAEPSQAGDIRINATESIRLTRNSIIENQVFFDATGNAGNIDIQTPLLSVSNEADISTSTFGNGEGGDLTITATDMELVNGGSLLAFAGEATGDAGNLTINTQNLSVRDGSLISTDTFGNGDAGNLTINTQNLSVRDGAFISTSTLGNGDAGNLTINTQNLSVQDGSLISTDTVGNGNAGNLTINTQNLLVQNGSLISTATFGEGDAGNLTVTAADVELVDSILGASVRRGAIGNGGTLTLNTQRLSVRDGAQIGADTLGNGDAGDLTITATDVELIGLSADGRFPSNLGATVQEGAIGNGGTLTLNTQRLSVIDGAQISTSTSGVGDGGDLTITATDVELVSGGSLGASVQPGGIGNGGTVTLNTQRLSVRDVAQISTSTSGVGDGGDLTITATDVELVGRSADGQFASSLGASVEPGGIGNGGTLTLNTQRLSVRDGAQISTSTLGVGDAGDLTITATNTELVDRALLTASVEPGGIGNGGTLTLNTQRLSVRDVAQILTATSGVGDAGDLTVTATDVELIGRSADGQFASGLAASVQEGAIGNGGTITLNTQRLSVRDGAQIGADTFGNGDGGDLTVTANDVELIGDRTILATSALSTSTGRGGTLTVNAENLTVRDQARIDVRSEGREGAGDLTINAPTILLDNQASLNGETTAGEGNIILNTSDLRLRRNSNITTNATGQATGGNITINTETLTALEDSDISANAEDAFGGQVTINADALFGTQFRPQQTNASDITATSELGPDFSGTVEINNEIDPARGLVDLSPTVVDPAALIAQDPCKLRGDSEFIITGRGGIASSPNNIFTGDRPQVPLVEPVEPVRSRQNRSTSTQPARTEPNQPLSSADIIPARGWIRDENGDVILVSYDPTKTGVRRQLVQFPQCQP